MVFWIMLIWVMVVGFFQPKVSNTILLTEDDSAKKINIGYCILMWSVPIFFITMCTFFGDKAGYLSHFILSPLDFNKLEEFTAPWKKYSLFLAIQGVVKILFIRNEHVWFCIIAVFQAACLTKTLRKYSVNFAVSIFIFTASTLMMSWMCNGIRQFVVVAIIFACTDWILEGKWGRFFVLLIILTGILPFAKIVGINNVSMWLGGIHQSAMVMIPIYFCLRGKPLNARMWIVVAILFVLLATGIFGKFISNTSYSSDLEQEKYQAGANPLRFLVAIVPVILVLIKFKDIKAMKNRPPIYDLCINASVVTAVLYAFSIVAHGELVGRLPIYTELYNLILIPWLIEKVYISHNKWIKFGLYSGYIVYFYFQVNLSWGDSPYQSSILGIY